MSGQAVQGYSDISGWFRWVDTTRSDVLTKVVAGTVRSLAGMRS